MRYDQKCILVPMCGARYSNQIVMKLDFSGQIFEKCANIKFHENPPSGRELFHADKQTDRHDEAFRNFANAPKKNVKFSLSTQWRHIGGVVVQFHSILTCALDGGEWSASHHDPESRRNVGEKKIYIYILHQNCGV